MIIRDQLWKAPFEEHFEDFVMFSFPLFFGKINFNFPPEFLDKELAKFAPTAAPRKKVESVLNFIGLYVGFEKRKRSIFLSVELTK